VFLISVKVQTSIHLDEPIKITLTGHNKTKIESLKQELENQMKLFLTASSHKGGGRCVFDAHVADSACVDVIHRMVARTRVVLSCLKVYAQYGNIIVAACASLCTDYVDTTTDIDWVGERRIKYSSTASASGCRIISLCGFGDVPSDLAILAAVETLKGESGNGIEIEKGFTWHANTGMATWANLKMLYESTIKARNYLGRSISFHMDDPLLLAHPKVRGDTKLLILRNKSVWREWLNRFSMNHTFLRGSPFTMATVNTEVVHTSTASLKYGPNFSHRESYLPVGFRGTAKLPILPCISTFLVHLAILFDVIVLKMPLLGSLLIFILEKLVSDETRASGQVRVYAEVRDTLGKNGKADIANALLKFKGDPLNGIKAQCVSEAALVLLLDNADLPERSEDGFGTPA